MRHLRFRETPAEVEQPLDPLDGIPDGRLRRFNRAGHGRLDVVPGCGGRGLNPVEYPGDLGLDPIDNAADEPTTVLRYTDLGLTLFFEGENPTLACIDTANSDATLFGEQVFELNERKIVELMVRNNYAEQDADQEDWGERRISFPQANIDFYFDQGELVSIILGQ